MGEIVRLSEARARRLPMRGADRGATQASTQQARAFEAVDCGDGWYHGEAIRASRKPSAEPR